ncbi:energy transducer TonB [Parablastomonas sp. CN1-191]|uniref:energy transducer TonB n=1 Tax=Parablastomonas sp. CN1-191 TaxID=3400908 RepID=UPI003BF7F38E
MTKFLAATLGIATSTAALAAEPDPILQPTTPWKVDYADKECRLLRRFGSGDSAITLRMAMGGSLRTFDLVLAGPSIPKLTERVKLAMSLEPQGKSQTIDGYSLALKDQSERFIRSYDASSGLIYTFTPNQVVAFTVAPAFSVRLNLTDASAAILALRSCYDDLLQSWGVDIAGIRRAVVPAEPLVDESHLMTADDYPTGPLRDEQQGSVLFQLLIDPTGKVTECRVVSSSNNPVLDKTTCDLAMRRARFAPARDAAGKAVPGAYVNRVRWMIPAD